MAPAPVHVAILVAHSPEADVADLEAFAGGVAEDVAPVLEAGTGAPWRFHTEDPTRLATDAPRSPADFLDEASLRMVEGPYDFVVVVTDVALVSRADRVVPGLMSPVARVAVASTRQLRLSPRGQATRPLASGVVRRNAAALLLHLLGHALGLRHRDGGVGTVMAPFRSDEARDALPTFSPRSRSRLQRRAATFREEIARDTGTVSEIRFHLSSALRHVRLLVASLWRSRALLLPLRLPRLTTAAVAPGFILVFTAEIWDAGFHMTGREVWLFAVLSVVGSALYLMTAQNVFLPRKEKRLHVEHLAVVNVALALAILAAVVGLFILVSGLMLAVQIFIFPPDLVREWPSLELSQAVIGFPDQLRIATLISTIGVLTGALAGGLESRAFLRHMALFEREP